MFTHLYRQSISCILSSVLLGNMLYAQGVVVDTGVAARHQATLDITGNGIPLVNIVTPNAAGLSHNKFSEFNINPQGLILNNATSAVQTQLGGWIGGNANLGTTPARVILNEVTGTHRSLLQGYGEVAGHAANVILANPNGITINGGGFINTPRATLTTGTPEFNGDALSGFHVQRGDILIEGSGLNATNIDYVDVYSKTLLLNGQIHAKGLDVVTGENHISTDGTVTSDNIIGTQAFSIDSSALGGIYANTIRLVATDKGVGVNLPQITYASDSLSLSADGHIVVGAAVASNTLKSTSKQLTVNEFLYGGNSIDLSASDTIHNTPNALILSHGDIMIHDTGTLLNDVGRIESSGDMVIQAEHIENLSSMMPSKSNLAASVVDLTYWADFRDWKTTTTSVDTINKTLYTPAYLLAGNDMTLAGEIHNRYSLIASDRDIYLFGSLNNEAALNAHEVIDISHYVEHWEKHGKFGSHAWYHNYSYFEHYDTITDHVYSTISAGGNLYGNLTAINNADVTAGTNLSSNNIAPSFYSQNLTTGEISYTLPSGGNGQFITSTNPTHPYLIESNPLYTNYNTFISSDYIMDRLHLNTAANTKRLGDGMYETQLVRDAVFRLTGERYLTGFGSDLAQYQGLMDNALAQRNDLNLELGIKLSSSQIAALTADIVWMEERVVEGQKVLVPVVYLSSLKTQTLSGGGKIIAGGDIQLAVSGTLSNGGEIRAGGTLLAQADTITNTGGSIKSSGDMLLHTTNDITNTSGTIRGNNVALISDNGSITSQTALKSLDLSNHIGTTGNLSLVGEAASIHSNGDMLLSAAKDITLTGAQTSAGGEVAIAAKNVTLTALEQNSHYKTVWDQGSSEIANVKQHSSTLNASGGVSINATRDVTLNSSTIEGKNISLSAGENVNITASNDREFRDVQTHNKSTFSSSSKRDMTLKESVVSSSINGDNITVTSGKDTTLQAANLKAQENIQVDATGDINVIAKTYRQGELHQESKSSLGGLSKSVSIDQLDSLNLQAATLKTEAKNIIMNSGKDINIIASKIESAADVQLKAFEDLLVASGEEVKSEKHVQEKTSFNIAGTVGIATGMMGLDTGSLYTKEIHKQDNYDTTAKSSTITAGGAITADTGSTTIIGCNLEASGDIRLKSDIGGINVLTAQELSNASSLDKKTEIKLVNLKEMIDGEIQRTKESLNPDGSSNTKVKVKVASATFDESAVQSSAVHNVSSSITSHEGSVKLDSSDDITITGSDLKAADTIDLKSDTGNITIQEATDSQTINSKEKHASAEVSATVQNEYVEIVSAVQAAIKSAEQLKKVKEDYSNYKHSLKELESTLTTLKQQYRDKVVGVDATDIEDLSEVITNTKEDQKYYIAAIAAATADLASKTVAIAAQVATAAASSGTWGFSVGMQLDMKGSKTTSNDQITQALASNLKANTITIQTDTTAPTTTTISGSNLNATNALNITTHNLDVQASSDTTTSKSDTKDLSGSVSITMYGGGASGASMGYGEQHATSESETHHNSTLNANTINLNITNDATLKGATVRADETLNLTVGNNLTVESVRDSSTSSSNGFNVSAGISTSSNAKTSSSGANASLGTNTGRTLNKQTVLTSLTGDNVNIIVGEETHLKGSLVAAGQSDENGVFQDNNNLNLSTKTLTFENLANTNYSSSNSMSAGGSYSDTLNKEKNEHKEKTTLTTSFSTGTSYERTKTLATLGTGNITITDKANSDDLSRLNTDTTKVDKALFKTNTGTSVDATLDTRLLTEKGQEEIKEEFKNMDENMKTIADTLPDATSDNEVEAVAGTIWDNVAGYTGGIVPSNANSGGVLGEVPILTGNKDSLKEVFQVVSSNSPRYNEEQESFMKIETSEAYKRMDEDKQKQVAGLYISINPVSINKDTATYQNPINGMMNDKAAAISNGFEQTGMLAEYKENQNAIVEFTQFYNPTRGIIADGLESLVDKLGGTTGIAKQAGEHIEDVTTARGAEGSNFPLHSQANLITFNGIEYVNSSGYTGDKFQSQNYFIKNNGDDSGIPTFVSFGSPKNGKDMKELIANKETGLGYTYMGAFTKPGDGVGELLGGNKGANEGKISPFYRFNPAVIVGEGLLLFSPWSPHSSYDPNNYSKELKGVTGYKE